MPTILLSAARRLARYHAAKIQDQGLADRFLEEWSADLDDTPGAFRKLLFALDLFRARRGIESTLLSDEPVPFSKGTMAYVISVALAGFYVVVVGLLGIVGGPSRSRWDVSWVSFIPLYGMAAFSRRRLAKRGLTVSLADSVILAATLVYGLYVGSVLLFIDASIVWIFLTSQRRWQKLVFNLGCAPLSLILANTALHLGGIFTLGRPVPAVLAVFAGAYYFVNFSLATFAVSLAEGLSYVRVWRQTALAVIPTYCAAIVLAAGLGWGFTIGSTALTVFLGTTFLGGYLLTAQHWTRTLA